MKDFVEAEHYTQVQPAEWPWRSFSPEEIACRGTGKLRISRQAMNRLQALREHLDAPLILNSAYRSPEHNKAVGGARDSYHVKGLAFDVSMQNHDPAAFEAAAQAIGFTGFGFYPPGKNFIHIDLGPRRVWGRRWKAPTFDREAKPKTGRKVAGVASLASLGAGAAEAIKPDSLAEIQHTVQPWIAAAPVFQALFAACGFGLVGWILWNRFFKAAP